MRPATAVAIQMTTLKNAFIKVLPQKPGAVHFQLPCLQAGDGQHTNNGFSVAQFQ
jgi:hypothetical protein